MLLCKKKYPPCIQWTPGGRQLAPPEWQCIAMLGKEMLGLKGGNNALLDSQQPQEILDFDNRGERRKGGNIPSLTEYASARGT